MKNLLSLFLCCLTLLIVQSCKTVVPVSETTFVSEKEGVIIIHTNGQGSNLEKAMKDAEVTAFDMLFFRGIIGSSQKIPLIGYDEVGLKNQYKAYFSTFYNKQRYKSFIQYSKPISDFKKKQVKIEITIHTRALRADLEDNGVIRKFGY